MFLLFHISTLHLALNSSAVKCDSGRKNPSNLWELPDFAAQTEDRHVKTGDIQEGAVNWILFFSDFSPILCTQIHISKYYRFSMAFRSCPHILDCVLLNTFCPVEHSAAWLLQACLQSRQQAFSRETTSHFSFSFTSRSVYRSGVKRECHFSWSWQGKSLLPTVIPVHRRTIVAFSWDRNKRYTQAHVSVNTEEIAKWNGDNGIRKKIRRAGFKAHSWSVTSTVALNQISEKKRDPKVPTFKHSTPRVWATKALCFTYFGWGEPGTYSKNSEFKKHHV